ncbi:MAG: helix-turn-helix domain-containing protein [Eubacterium sp.]|nr:helix-turn-helix domain-containing protein [Eubacterium sp.]
MLKEKMLIQAAVAKKMGYNPKTFNDMLKGRKLILADDIPKICEGLGITPNELYGYDETA